jgi:hypothetical protein
VVGTCKTHTSKWETLMPFGQCMHHLPVDVGRLSEWRPKHRITLYIMISHVLAFITRRSFGDNLPLFSLFSTSKGVLALQLTFDFLCFFNQTWFLFFLFLFILLLIFFSDWFLFFDLIPNHLILIFFLLNLILILMIVNPLFWLLLLINFFFAMPSLIVYFH